MTITYIQQRVLSLPQYPLSIPVHRFASDEVSRAAVFLRSLPSDVYGISLALSASGDLQSIGLSTVSTTAFISFEKPTRSPRHSNDKDLRDLLTGLNGIVAGFDMAFVALHIHRCLKFHVQAIDLSTLISPSTRSTLDPAMFLAKVDAHCVNIGAIHDIQDDGESNESRFKNVSLRAWMSAIAATSYPDKLTSTLKIYTNRLSAEELSCLGELVLKDYLCQIAKPRVRDNEFNKVVELADGDLMLHNARYSNRVRRSTKTSVVITGTDGNEIVGRPVHAEGKGTTIKINKGEMRGGVSRIRVVGKEELTQAELDRNEFLLRVLRGERSLYSSTFICLFWFSNRQRPPVKDSAIPPPNIRIQHKVNDSQLEVVNAMVYGMNSIVVAHGPPGTGKTTTISTAVDVWHRAHKPVWIVAQSNVAVKNIAESLAKRDIQFTLLVSKEFYVEWHEHIYEKVERNLLRADELPDDKYAMERQLAGSKVVLCTLSMLSNPILEERFVYDLIPVERLVVDEASQINVFDFMHIFAKFKRLTKVCLFGDPKQLPPYGQDSQKIQSVYDLKHLKKDSFFLRTQYRMPVPLGEFISHAVYNSKLLSEHKLKDSNCLAFVDVGKGREQSAGHSWTNAEEVQTVVNLVRYYYKHKNFCVITPYDAQRAALEKALQAANLPWEHVYNVDSFQGNEADYVLVSVVRTQRPGFLVSKNRVNVMLTRCKAGMVIVSNSVFLRMEAQFTLLGELAKHWADKYGYERTWVDWRAVAERKANLLGCSASATLGPSQRVNITGSSTAQVERGTTLRTYKPQVGTVASHSPFNIVQDNKETSDLSRRLASMNIRTALNAHNQRVINPQSTKKPAQPKLALSKKPAADNHFPLLPSQEMPPNTQLQLKGKWKKGSKKVSTVATN